MKPEIKALVRVAIPFFQQVAVLQYSGMVIATNEHQLINRFFSSILYLGVAYYLEKYRIQYNGPKSNQRHN
jgi:hypothetical protein